MAEALLEVSGLTVQFGTARAVDGLDLAVAPGEVLGLVGESGSGKSVTALAIMGLLPAARIAAGSVRFAGQELLGMDRAALRRLRGGAVSMIFQEPMTSLNPVLTIGVQMTETILAHERVGLRAARERSIDLLDKVGITAPVQRMAEYPHRLSGGTRQRVMIAMALACGPRLLIADEPTTALDVTIQAQILDLLRRLQHEFHMAVLLITHNLGITAEFADRLAVLYAGRVMETGDVAEVFGHPAHPYTSGLLGSIPPLDARLHRLAAIPGAIPEGGLPPGCRFAPRCAHARPECDAAVPAPNSITAGHATACIRYPGIDPGAARPVIVEPVHRPEAAEPLLIVEDLHKHFPLAGGRLAGGRLAGGRMGRDGIRAVDGISFAMRPGETLALVGESGCGKTTTAQLVLGLQAPSSGRVVFDGVTLTDLPARELRAARRGMQVVFQDPAGSLDPRMAVGEIVGEPLAIAGWARAARERRVRELLDRVGLAAASAVRHPHEFSGGQRQRIAIARALAPSPKLILCDEPVSALDVSIQAQIINLLHDLKETFGVAYLFITHDLGVVRQVADRVAVMYLGRIVEMADADTLFAAPRHPYTRTLLEAVPSIASGRRTDWANDVAVPIHHRGGCDFRNRCKLAMPLCAEQRPPLDQIARAGHAVACHLES